MAAEPLARRSVQTDVGPLEFHGRPEKHDPARPVVVAVTGLFAGPDDLVKLPDMLGIYADGVVVPLLQAMRLETPGVEAAARAVGALIDQAFAGRQVVLMGVSLGATVCLAVRSPHVRRIVAVEPVLVVEKLWPVLPQVRQRLAALPAGQGEHRLWSGMLGVGPVDAFKDYRPLLAELPAPVDVVLGGAPLYPEREAPRFPSLVDAPERQLLAATRKVRLHVDPAAGHNVQAQSALALEVTLEACRRAAAAHGYDPRAIDEPLLEATPLDASRVTYRGPEPEAFRAALRARNPKAAVSFELGGEASDAIVLGGPPASHELPELASALAANGCLIARWAPEAAGAADLAAAGLAPLAPVDAAGTGVVRLARAEAARGPLRVQSFAYAPLLMDIRTRLPAQMLASSPDLAIAYRTKPFALPPLDRDTPKVLVLQRPGDLNLENNRAMVAEAMAGGWVTVLEYDDHPRVIGEVLGSKGSSPQAMARFGYFHAVQTSTPALQEAFRVENPEVTVFPNAVFELMPFPEGPRPRRVVYGGVLRGEFAAAVAASLAAVTADFPDLQFEVIGDKAVFEALPTARKTLHGYMSYEAYLRLMGECAISLSPMEDRPLRDTKSDAKFLDAARAGVLTIASPVIYDRVITHGENGLLARTLEDWPAQLRLALSDTELQTRLARRAWEYVRDERMFAGQVAARRDWYWSLWRRRDELDETLLQRVPGMREALQAAVARRGSG